MPTADVRQLVISSIPLRSTLTDGLLRKRPDRELTRHRRSSLAPNSIARDVDNDVKELVHQ